MSKYEELDVKTVGYDPDNPRITTFLEPYEDVDHEIIAQALQPNDAKYLELKRAIETNDGIINPIIVNRTNGQLITIEGNTRLAIYRLLHEETPDDSRWATIPAFVYNDMSKAAIDAIRLQAHLVGVRNWSPYAKAKYLYQLSQSEHLPINALVDFCGGNRHDVMRNIEAFKQMEFQYKPVAKHFAREKFSLFFEAQKPKIKNAITKAGFKERDFINWIVSGKFEPRQELVRELPKIFENERAREAFLSDGAAKAVQYIDRPELRKELLEASLVDLCYAVQGKISDLKLAELDDIRQDVESTQCIEDTQVSLQNFYNNHLSA